MPLSPLSFGSIRVRTPLALPGQRIGLIGGSFNPPHAGHLALSEIALKRLRLDRIWWIVSPGNPLKSQTAMADQALRLAACRALVTDPRITITGFEQALDSAFTSVSLGFLRGRYARSHFVWIMGADNLAGFHRWHNWRRIAAAMPIAVIDRPGWRLKAMAAPAARVLERSRVAEQSAPGLASRPPPAWTYLTAQLPELSSSALRARSSAWAGRIPRIWP